MTNLIKMDMYRLVRSISFWVMIAVVVALAFFSMGMTKYVLDTVPIPEKNTAAARDEVQMNLGIYVETDPEWVDGDVAFAEMLNADLASRLILIVCVIFISLFVNAEHKNGFIKNIAGQLGNRGMLILSKLFTAAVQVFVILTVYALSVAAAGCLFWGERFVAGSFSDFLSIFNLHYLLHFSFGAVVLMLTILSKSSAASMVFGILCAGGVSELAYSLVNIAVHSIGGPEQFDISKIMLTTNIASITSELGSGDLIRIVTVGTLFAAAAAAVSMAAMQKRDIR